MTGGWSMPTYSMRSWDLTRDAIPNDAVLISNDELACAYAFRLPRFWLAVAGSEATRFTRITPSGAVGLYSGAPVIASDRELTAAIASSSREVVLVLFNAGRFDFAASSAFARRAATRFGGAIVVDDPQLLAVRFGRRGPS